MIEPKPCPFCGKTKFTFTSESDYYAVPREEYDLLLKRFRHLMESNFIASFDKYNPKTGTYKRDIAEADDAEPVRHAKWVWDNDAIDWNLGAWVCSECRHRNENIHAGMPGINGGVWSNPYIWSGSNYCPNCGAKMEGDAK